MKRFSIQHKGFTLLMAVITTSMLLIVSYMVVNIAYKQLLISNTNQESQYAFYSADSGVECATYWDLKAGPSVFSPSTGTSISCNGSSITPSTTSYNSSGISTSSFTVALTKGCVDVDVVKNQSTGVTTVNSRGYNNCAAGAQRKFQRGVTITYPMNPPYAQSVTWQNAVGMSVSGNNLTRSTSGTWGSAGASSAQNINSGNGYVEFSTKENNLAKAGALSHGDSDQNYTSLNYSIILNNSGGVAIYENNTSAGVINTYVAGDVFRIEIKNGYVNYYKNGALLCATSVCSHTTTPTYPLIFDTSFNQQNSTITNAAIAS
jgi:hypothetical protein